MYPNTNYSYNLSQQPLRYTAMHAIAKSYIQPHGVVHNTHAKMVASSQFIFSHLQSALNSSKVLFTRPARIWPNVAHCFPDMSNREREWISLMFTHKVLDRRHGS